jgi:hypothetical protein
MPYDNPVRSDICRLLYQIIHGMFTEWVSSCFIQDISEGQPRDGIRYGFLGMIAKFAKRYC